MKFLFPFSISLLFVSCAATPTKPSPEAGAGVVKYRYENTIDIHNNNTLDHVVITGYDEKNLGEVTRLDVSAGGPVLSLRNQQDVGGAMYTPWVEKTPKGDLLVAWGSIDDGYCKVELAVDAAGNLTVKTRREGTH